MFNIKFAKYLFIDNNLFDKNYKLLLSGNDSITSEQKLMLLDAYYVNYIKFVLIKYNCGEFRNCSILSNQNLLFKFLFSNFDFDIKFLVEFVIYIERLIVEILPNINVSLFVYINRDDFVLFLKSFLEIKHVLLCLESFKRNKLLFVENKSVFFDNFFELIKFLENRFNVYLNNYKELFDDDYNYDLLRLIFFCRLFLLNFNFASNLYFINDNNLDDIGIELYIISKYSVKFLESYDNKIVFEEFKNHLFKLFDEHNLDNEFLELIFYNYIDLISDFFVLIYFFYSNNEKIISN